MAVSASVVSARRGDPKAAVAPSRPFGKDYKRLNVNPPARDPFCELERALALAAASPSSKSGSQKAATQATSASSGTLLVIKRTLLISGHHFRSEKPRTKD